MLPYSLGAILYHMLTGHLPFLGSPPVETVLMVLEQDQVAPRALNRRADRQLEMIAMRCLQKPQDLRYQNAGDLSGDVKAFLRNESDAASEGRFRSDHWKRFSRNTSVGESPRCGSLKSGLVP
jgi:serine/threonine protein kinase